MPAWPVNLPQLPFEGATQKDRDSVLRNPMDIGSTRRNRFTTNMQDLSFPMVLTGAELVDFHFFYRTDLKKGALAFDWIDLTNDIEISVAFLGPPQWVLRAGAALAADRVWTAVLNLEVQP